MTEAVKRTNTLVMSVRRTTVQCIDSIDGYCVGLHISGSIICVNEDQWEEHLLAAYCPFGGCDFPQPHLSGLSGSL